MSKEFVRNIRNTTINEPLSTNEQNDILSDTDNVYIRNKNGYFPITKSILNIKATDTIVSVAESIDGTPNNSVTLSTNETILKEFIEKYTKNPEISINVMDIKDLISVENGLVKELKDEKVHIKSNHDINQIFETVEQQKETLVNHTNKIQTLENETKIKIIELNNNYNDTFQELESNQDIVYILKYNEQHYFKAGKSNNRYYFFNLNKTTQTGFIDFEIIELMETSANLIVTSITPSEVKAI